MIIELICIPIFNILLSMLSALPTLNEILIPASVAVQFANIVAICGYFLPIQDMFIIFGIWVSYVIFRMSFNFLKTIREALPFI